MKGWEWWAEGSIIFARNTERGLCLTGFAPDAHSATFTVELMTQQIRSNYVTA